MSRRHFESRGKPCFKQLARSDVTKDVSFVKSLDQNLMEMVHYYHSFCMKILDQVTSITTHLLVFPYMLSIL